MSQINGLEVKKPLDLPEYNNYLIDGVAGSGKTTLLGTVGKGNKILIIDMEGGSASYSSPVFSTIKDATEIENIDIVATDWDKLTAAQVIHAVEGVFDHLIKSKNAEGYVLVGVDSVTELQKRFIYSHSASDPRQSYGAWADSLYAIVNKARACPTNVVFLSRPRVSKDEVTGSDIIRSDISPAAWSVVSGLMDANGLLSSKTNMAGKTTRTLDFTPSQRYAAKQRLGLEELENPSMKDLLDRVRDRSKQPVAPAAPVSKPRTLAGLK